MINETDMLKLKDYSYFIFAVEAINAEGQKISHPISGTCFFVRNNKKLLLVSAKHVLTAWDPTLGKKKIPFANNFTLRLFDGNGIIKLKGISVEETNNEITGGFTYDDPDIHVMEIEDSAEYNIHSVENLIEDFSVIEPNDEIALFGYPLEKDFFNPITLEKLNKLEPILVEGKLLPVDSIYRNDQIKQLEDLNFAIEHQHVAIRQGCSGAPAFAKSEEKWSFCGIFINASPEVPVSLILKKDYLFCKLS